MNRSSRNPMIGARVPVATKAAFASLAAARGLSESALLVLLVDAVLERNPVPAPSAPVDRGPCDRITLRLRPGDLALLEHRAAGRGMKPASYLTMLVHAHVRGDAPLPACELNALKAAANQLSSLRSALRSSTGGTACEHGLGEVSSAVADLHRSLGDFVRCHLRSWETNQ